MSGKYRSKTDSYIPELHEYAHAIDKFGGFSASNAFRTAWDGDRGGMKRYYNYAQSGPGESFAESFSKFYGGDKSMKKEWPKLYNYMKTLDTCMSKKAGGC